MHLRRPDLLCRCAPAATPPARAETNSSCKLYILFLHDLCGSLGLAITQPREAHVQNWFLVLLACPYTHCWLVWPSAVFGLQAIQLCQ